MPKDPAFLFYPGDYLRDTQCLSEKTQVAYDRIMCEHMRNICISEKQLNFFTKRLSDDEKEELLMTLTKVEGGFQIVWVAESIVKRRAYSESRRNNRTKKQDKISKTYVSHMENENENIDNNSIKGEFLNSQKWIETICMNKRVHKIEPKDVQEYLKTFLDDLELKGELDKPRNEIKKHFINWLNIELKKTKNGTDKKPNSKGKRDRTGNRKDFADG